MVPRIVVSALLLSGSPGSGASTDSQHFFRDPPPFLRRAAGLPNLNTYIYLPGGANERTTATRDPASFLETMNFFLTNEYACFLFRWRLHGSRCLSVRGEDPPAQKRVPTEAAERRNAPRDAALALRTRPRLCPTRGSASRRGARRPTSTRLSPHDTAATAAAPRRLVPCICCDGGRVGGRVGDRVADNDRKPDRERKERGILWQPAQKAAETRLHEARLRLHKARLANVSRSAIRIARRLRGPTAPHREL